MAHRLSPISPKFSEETLQQIVQKIKPGSSLKDYDLDECKNRGCSYLSEVNRIKITGQLHGEAFRVETIVKSLPRSVARRMTFRSPDFFAREIEFFTLWSEFEQFQQRHNILEPYSDVPRCLATFQDGQHDFIALEDLSANGYRTIDRQVGVDAAHCKIALTSLGKFHGVSHAMRTLEPDTFRRLTSHLVDHYYAEEAREWFKEMATLEIQVARDALRRECPGTAVEQRMHEFTDSTENFYTRMVEMTHAVNEFSVIGHGDCWMPNFLFKYASDPSLASCVPIQVKMIDFQLARLCSSALDISFFIYSCTTQQLRTDHFADMIQCYYEGVQQILRQFHLDASKVFPLSELQNELKLFGKFGVGVAMEAVPLSIMPEADTTDMDTIEGSQPLSLPEVWILKPIGSQEGRERLVDVFNDAVHRGYL